MSNPVPVCVHVKADGTRCGSSAVSGTELCYHHSVVKTQLGKRTPPNQVAHGEFTPIPFMFPEDRASLQINYFLLFQAFTEERVERRAAELMFRMLREMGRNLGKSGSLVDQDSEQGSGHRAQETSDPRSAVSDQEERVQKSGAGDQKERVQRPGAGERKAVSRETVSVQASAAEIFVGPIAPESCFSTQPVARNPWT